MSAKLIIYPPDEQGWRRVRYDGVAIGVAHRPSDIRVFLADAGLENAEDVDLTDPDFVEWRGAGPEAWNPSPTPPPEAPSTPAEMLLPAEPPRGLDAGQPAVGEVGALPCALRLLLEEPAEACQGVAFPGARSGPGDAGHGGHALLGLGLPAGDQDP